MVAAATDALRDFTLADGFVRDFDADFLGGFLLNLGGFLLNLGGFLLNRGDLAAATCRLCPFFGAFDFALVLVAISLT